MHERDREMIESIKCLFLKEMHIYIYYDTERERYHGDIVQTKENTNLGERKRDR